MALTSIVSCLSLDLATNPELRAEHANVNPEAIGKELVRRERRFTVRRPVGSSSVLSSQEGGAFEGSGMRW